MALKNALESRLIYVHLARCISTGNISVLPQVKESKSKRNMAVQSNYVMNLRF